MEMVEMGTHPNWDVSPFKRRYPKEKYRSAPWWQGLGSEGPMEIQKYRIRLVEILNEWDEREFVPLRLFVPGVPEALMQAPDQLRVEDRVYIEQLLSYIKDPRAREAVEFYYGLKGEKPLTQEEIARRIEPQTTRANMGMLIKGALDDMRRAAAIDLRRAEWGLRAKRKEEGVQGSGQGKWIIRYENRIGPFLCWLGLI